MLKDGASAYISPPDGLQETHHRLIQLGRRRARCFLRNGDDPHELNKRSPFLCNILENAKFMSLFKDTESQIKFLRHKANVWSSHNTASDAFIIRYSQPGTTWDFTLKETSAVDEDPEPYFSSLGNAPEAGQSMSTATIEQPPSQDSNASNIPNEQSTTNESRDQKAYSEWLSYEAANIHPTEAVEDQTDTEGESDSDYYPDTDIGASDEEMEISDREDDITPGRIADLKHSYEGRHMCILTTALTPKAHQQAEDVPHHRWVPRYLQGVVFPKGETITRNSLEKFMCWADNIQIITAESSDDYVYHYVLGDQTMAALFARHVPNADHPFNSAPTIEDLEWCLENDLLSPIALHHYLCVLGFTGEDPISKTLRALAVAALVYDNLADATIDVNILSSPLTEKHWASSMSLDNMSTSSPRVLSLISYFESGIHDVDPKQLTNVIAVSYANSLFVDSALIQDPLDTLTKHTLSFRRILGNIGKPGLTFLLPPQEPISRDINTEGWNIDRYRRFDGTKAQSFENTSVHLSFTEYHVPLFDGSRGAQDNQISFLESIISVQDKGKWVADVDPLSFFSSHSHLRCPDTHISCQHTADHIPDQDITAVDTWDELLDVPTGAFVVRTGDNWVGRLASTLVVHQRMREISAEFAVTVCPPRVCWTCERSSLRHHAYIY